MAETHRHEELNDAVQYFNVLVLQPAAQHRGQLWVLLFLPPGGRKAVGLTPRPIVLPPRAMGRHPQGKYITVLEWEEIIKFSVLRFIKMFLFYHGENTDFEKGNISGFKL